MLHSSLLLFCVFNSSWSGLWGFPTALKYALTCSTYCLVCVNGGSRMNCMVSSRLSLAVLSKTLTALFCTLSSFSRSVVTLLRGLVQSMQLSTRHIQHKQVLNTLCSHSLQDQHVFPALHYCFNVLSICIMKYSVRVDPNLSQR